jgi:hypothetical protein
VVAPAPLTVCVATLDPGNRKRIDSRKQRIRWADQLSSSLATVGTNATLEPTLSNLQDMLSSDSSSTASQSLTTSPAVRTNVDEFALTEAAERKAIADSVLKVKHDNYLTLHCAFNHNAAAIARARADKSFTFANVKRPPDFACPSCAAASNSSAKFSHGRSAPDPASLEPFHDVEIDVWGPFDAGDPVGNRYAFLGIDRATGKRFFQPMSRKSGCVVAMQFMAHVKSLADKVEFKHNMQKGSCAI